MCRTVHKKCWSRHNSINPALKWNSKQALLGFYSFPPPPVSFLWIVVNILFQREIVNSQGWAKSDYKRLDQQQINTSVLRTHYWVPQNLACPLSKGISVNVPGIKNNTTIQNNGIFGQSMVWLVISWWRFVAGNIFSSYFGCSVETCVFLCDKKCKE